MSERSPTVGSGTAVIFPDGTNFPNFTNMLDFQGTGVTDADERLVAAGSLENGGFALPSGIREPRRSMSLSG